MPPFHITESGSQLAGALKILLIWCGMKDIRKGTVATIFSADVHLLILVVGIVVKIGAATNYAISTKFHASWL